MKATHAIERTSPKGDKFIGTCMRCGMTGLSLADAYEPCGNIAGISSDKALLTAVEGPKRPSTRLERLLEKQNRREP